MRDDAFGATSKTTSLETALAGVSNAHRRMPLNRKALFHCTPSSEYPVRRRILCQCTYTAIWKLLYIPLRSSYLLVPGSWESSLRHHSNVQYVINSYKHWYLIQTLVANCYNMVK